MKARLAIRGAAAAFAAALMLMLGLAGGAQAGGAPADEASAADAGGDWLGTLSFSPSLAFRLAVHLHKSAEGGWAGTIDSLDQGVFDRPLADIAVGRAALAFADPAVAGRFEGQWDAAARRWVGQWTQAGQPARPLILIAGVAPPAPTIGGLDGEWDGTLALGAGVNLRLAFHISTGPRGTRATVDSVDQGSYGAPVSSVSRDGDHVRLELKGIGATVDGALEAGGTRLVATFSQGAVTAPLTLQRLASGEPSLWPAPPKPTPGPPPADWVTPSDAEIGKILQARIDAQRQGVGMVVGVVDAHGRRIIAWGRLDQDDPRPLGGGTVFEIGSITKVFTSLVLADMARRGEVKLDDPIALYLPPGVKAPERNGKPITLVELATHTSGLPRLPTNMAPKDPANPYADYGDDQLWAFLNGYALTRDPGATWEYSNLGAGLLGTLLARRAGLSYEALLRTRILTPLGMTSTGVALTAAEQARLTPGHDASLAKVANWDLTALAGAGALRSTADDMLTFLAANLGLTPTPLMADMQAMLAIRRPTGAPEQQQALGWLIRQSGGREIVWHNGGTGGYRSFVGFDPKARVGVVVLTNAATIAGGDDIGFHILTGSPVLVLAPAPAPAPVRQAITLPAHALQKFVGRYRLTPTMVIEITRQGDHLIAQLTGQAAFEIFPETPTDFFWRVVDAQARFQLDAVGAPKALVLHQNGRDLTAPKIGAAVP